MTRVGRRIKFMFDLISSDIFITEVPSESYNLNHPVLFVAFTEDVIAIPAFGDGTHTQYVKGPYTRRELAGDHWAVATKADEVNMMLLEWTEGLVE